MTDNNVDKRTATQKIEDLEKGLVVLFEACTRLDQQVRQLQPQLDEVVKLKAESVLIKDSLALLDKKGNAIIQLASTQSAINNDSVEKVMIEMNLVDLKKQVDIYLTNGQIVASEVASSSSFLVCEELDAKNGTIANPRVQFRLDGQEPTTISAFTGKKVGDTISFGEDRFPVRILELYDIVIRQVPAAVPPATDTTPPADTSSPEDAAAPTEETPAPTEETSTPTEGPSTPTEAATDTQTTTEATAAPAEGSTEVASA